MEENKIKTDNNAAEELSDDELKEVTAGDNFELHFFDTEDEVYFIFPIGSTVIVKEHFFSSKITCTVRKHVRFYDPQYSCYEDLYYVEDPDGKMRKVLRDDIVNQAF